MQGVEGRARRGEPALDEIDAGAGEGEKMAVVEDGPLVEADDRMVQARRWRRQEAGCTLGCCATSGRPARALTPSVAHDPLS